MDSNIYETGRYFLFILAEIIPLFLGSTFIIGLSMEYISEKSLQDTATRRAYSGCYPQLSSGS